MAASSTFFVAVALTTVCHTLAYRCIENDGQIICGPEQSACVESPDGAIVCGETVAKVPARYTPPDQEEDEQEEGRSGYTRDQISYSEADVKMRYRQMGKTGLRTSVLGFGSWITFDLQLDNTMAYELMKRAFRGGINFFDTAEAYMDGAAESIMGECIVRGLADGVWRRQDLVISTKVFWNRPIKNVNAVGLSRKHVIEGVLNSLERLKIEYADVVFAHRPDEHTPIEETVRAFNWLLDHGKIFYWGTSMWSAAQIATAQGVADRLHLVGPTVEQPEYSLLKRDRVESEYQTLYKSTHGLGTTIYSPLAMGVLTGKYNDGVPEGSRLAMENRYKNLKDNVLSEGRFGSWDELVKKLKAFSALAKELGASSAQLAMAWCIKNPRVSSAIFGASSMKQLEENLDALKLLPMMTRTVMDEIDAMFNNKPAGTTDFVQNEMDKL
eukprot:m.193514 g.193514  ORF g.193514 m.193514 type:complete len:441 (-) comp32505_c2_seq1:94-1416(-)